MFIYLETERKDQMCKSKLWARPFSMSRSRNKTISYSKILCWSFLSRNKSGKSFLLKSVCVVCYHFFKGGIPIFYSNFVVLFFPSFFCIYIWILLWSATRAVIFFLCYFDDHTMLVHTFFYKATVNDWINARGACYKF